MTHETFRELLPLYVIGALDAGELRAFDQYVAANRSRCEAEIAEFQAVANQLALAAPPVKPSPEVLNRIMARIEPAVRQPAERIAESEPGGLALFLKWIPCSVAAALCIVTLAALWMLQNQNQTMGELRQRAAQLNDRSSVLQAQLSELTARVDEQTKTMQTQVNQLQSVNHQLTRKRDDLRQQIEHENLQLASLQGDFDRQTSRLNLMMDPTVHVGQLADPDKKSTAAAKVFWQPEKNAGLVVVSNLPVIPKGGAKSLELWVICDGAAPVPAGLFWTDAAGHGVGEIKMAKQVSCTPKFAVSVEPQGGVDSPTGPIVLLGQ